MEKRKLTNISENRSIKKVLTDSKNPKFTVRFGEELCKGYGFSELEKHSAHKFTRFLDNMVGQNWLEVDQKYLRRPDRNDRYKDNDVIHYGTGGSGSEFRLHGYIEEGVFVVIRIDPNHKFHG